MKQLKPGIILAIALVGTILVKSMAYTVHQTEQVVITQFGELIGEPVTDPGLHFKLPFIQEVNRIEKRFLPWDGDPNEMPTKDKTYILVDTFARWRINQPAIYFPRLRNEISAISRLNDILGSETRNAIAKHDLIEVIRTTKDRVPERDATLVDAPGNIGVLYPITEGRAKVEREIFEKAAGKLADFGIELLDVRFKRINYNQSVRRRIYDRMISERQQIAERFRSEGAGEAAKIIGRKEKDMQEIESEAYKRVQEVKGAADGRATEIYAGAYNQSPEAAEFYTFLKTLETYQTMLGIDTSLILTTDSPLFHLLKTLEPDSVAQPKR